MCIKKYLYIDDDSNSIIKPFKDELTSFDCNLVIEHMQPTSMKKIINKFIEDRFDGLIIDQKLDAVNENKESVDYWGTSLAQNFRTEMIGKIVPPSPIILLSNEDVYTKYFDTDESAQDLFDFTLSKRNVASDTIYAEKASKIIYSLAEAYSIARVSIPVDTIDSISTFDLLAPLLQWNEQIYKFTDARFLEYLKLKSHDIHTLVSLILNNFVRSAGILVTERMLATKLGIDIEHSNDWEKLKNKFISYKYNGVFSSIKDRWWMSRIEDWWFECCSGTEVLRALTATERVNAIKLFTSLENLEPIKSKYKNGMQSEKYWVNCIVSGTPLDPYDALPIIKLDQMQWEEQIYLDPEVVYNRGHKPKYSVHPDYQSKVKPLYRRLSKND
ncbi:hypothetical protein MMK73_000858 [Providencia rettgeri]|uniref:protein-PII uridylyltransferase n=1 Tax=Providencia TaxID=586 RepID=UPI0012B551C0|nr:MULTISPECIES: protein-PII uridylyltransferase [Providencia]ELR5229994.1 hypothetical protein [Providencia rettgeri]MTC50074.1 protein-PII uridylyltransferase [Providencia alcalifaciens]